MHEDVLVDNAVFGSTGENADVIVYTNDNDQAMQFNLFPYKDGLLMIEAGSHIYPDEDDTGMLVSDLISEIYNSIEL